MNLRIALVATLLFAFALGFAGIGCGPAPSDNNSSADSGDDNPSPSDEPGKKRGAPTPGETDGTAELGEAPESAEEGLTEFAEEKTSETGGEEVKSRGRYTWAVRNGTGMNLKVAYANYENNAWVSRGWYLVKPGETRVLISNLTMRDVYYRATSSHAVWQGAYGFRTQSSPFTFINADCPHGPGTVENFCHVDTGDYSHVTVLTCH